MNESAQVGEKTFVSILVLGLFFFCASVSFYVLLIMYVFISYVLFGLFDFQC